MIKVTSVKFKEKHESNNRDEKALTNSEKSRNIYKIIRKE